MRMIQLSSLPRAARRPAAHFSETVLSLTALGSRAVLALALLASALSARADVRLAAVFSDHAVLQQGVSVPIWGWADEGEQVTVQFRKQTASTTAHGGKWLVRLGQVQGRRARHAHRRGQEYN